MEQKVREQKKQSGIDFRPIISLLIGLSFFTIILAITLTEAGKGRKMSDREPEDNGADRDSYEKQEAEQAVPYYDSEVLAVLKEIHTENKSVTLYDAGTKETLVLSYTGGSSILDKYGQVIAISQLKPGQIIDAGYTTKDHRLVKLQVSKDAWEYIGVSNMTMDLSNHILKIAQTKYKFEDELIVIDHGDFVPLSSLAPQDVLTVWGVEETILSITVDKGHGTVRLTDYEAFLGGNVSVGYEAMQQISENSVLTVREGNFNLTVENGEYTGTKNITVNRNEETVVSIGDLGPKPVPRGSVSFEISPFGADLFIDSELTPYATPVELAYGEHEIEVSLGGYTTYKGTLSLNSEGKYIKIDLPEIQSNQKVSIIETGEEGGSEPEPIKYNDWDGENATETPKDEEAPEGNLYADVADPILDEEHLIYIQNPVGASVYLNGEFMGISPGSFKKVIGSHVLTFIKKGYRTKSYTIEVADDGLDTYFSLPDLEFKE